MFERFSRSWALIKASAAVLQLDRELLLFPFVSSIASAIVAASFLAPAFALGWLGEGGRAEEGEISIEMMVWGFLFYFAQYFVIFFFNSALVGAAMIRLDGGDPTVADGLRIAASRVGPILGYAAIAATVGVILRAIQERAGFIGRAVTGLIGVAWTFATFLVVPILVSRDIGPVDALKESASLLRKTWGENLIGNGGIGVVFGVLYVVVALLGVALLVPVAALESPALVVTIVVAVAVALLLLALIQGALSGIYSAALYRYAASGDASTGFTTDAFAAAFRHKSVR